MSISRKGYLDPHTAELENIRSREGDAAIATFELGNLHLRAGRLHEASLEYEKCLEVKPEYLAADYNLTVVCGALGEWENALEQALRILAGKEDFLEIFLILGKAFLMLGKTKEAAGSFLAALARDDRFFQAQLGFAEVLYFRNPKDLSSPSREVEAALAVNPDSFEARYFLAELSALKGEHAKACDEYMKALRMRNSSRLASLGVAASYLAVGKDRMAPPAAVRASKDLKRSSFDQFRLPDRVNIPPSLVDCAHARAQHLMTLFPGHWESHILMALVLEQKKSFEKAIELYEQAQNRWGGNPWLTLKLGRLNHRIGRLGVAVEYYRAYLEHDPDNVQILLITGKCLIELEDYAEASELLERMLTSGLRSAEVRLLLAKLHEKSGDARRAEEHYQAFLELKPGHQTAVAALETLRKKLGWREFYTRGIDQFAHGLVDEAMSTWKTGLAVEEAPELHIELGTAYIAKGLTEEAAGALTRAEALLAGGAALGDGAAERIKALRGELAKRGRAEAPATPAVEEPAAEAAKQKDTPAASKAPEKMAKAVEAQANETAAAVKTPGQEKKIAVAADKAPQAVETVAAAEGKAQEKETAAEQKPVAPATEASKAPHAAPDSAGEKKSALPPPQPPKEKSGRKSTLLAPRMPKDARADKVALPPPQLPKEMRVEPEAPAEPTVSADEQAMLQDLLTGLLAAPVPGGAKKPATAAEKTPSPDLLRGKPASPAGEETAQEAAQEHEEKDELKLDDFGKWLERELKEKAKEKAAAPPRPARGAKEPAAAPAEGKPAEAKPAETKKEAHAAVKIETKVSDMARRKEMEQATKAPLQQVTAESRLARVEEPPPLEFDLLQGLFWAIAGGWYPALLMFVLFYPSYPGAYLFGGTLCYLIGIRIGKWAELDEWFHWKTGFVCAGIAGLTCLIWFMERLPGNQEITLGSIIFLALVLGGALGRLTLFLARRGSVS